MYSLKELTAPASEPVTLALVKKHLAIDHAEDDDLITQDIIAARKLAEGYTAKIFGSRTFLFSTNHWPCDRDLALPVEPVTAVTAVNYEDIDGVIQTVAPSNYRLWLDASPPVIRFGTFFAYPPFHIDAPAGLTVEFTAGDDAPEPMLAKAIELTVEYWRKFPGGEDTLGHLSRGLPSGAINLLTNLWSGQL